MIAFLKNAASDLFENAFQGNALLTKEGKFLYVNKVFCHIIGYSEAELKSKRWQDITHEDDIGPDQESAHRVAEGRLDSYELEKRYIKKNGEVIWIRLKVCAVKDERGVFVCFLSMIVPANEKFSTTSSVIVAPNEFGRTLRILAWALDKAPAIAAIIVGCAAILYYLFEYARHFLERR